MSSDLDNRTIANVRTEKKAKQYLVDLNEGYHEFSVKVRQQIIDSLLIEPKFKNSFDLIKLESQRLSPVTKLSLEEIGKVLLIDVKSSSRDLTNGLKGHYFSVQQREIDLAILMPTRMFFAFVVLPRSGADAFHEILSWKDISGRLTAQRVQININF